MEIKRRFQNFCQKDQKLNFTTTKIPFFQGPHLRDLRCPHSTLVGASELDNKYTCSLNFKMISQDDRRKVLQVWD